MKSRNNNSESGFTLIEVIITLVIVAVVAAMMTAYFGTGITQSSIPIFRLSDAARLNQIMEKITSDYNKLPPTWSPTTTYPANTVILPATVAKRTGYQYIGGGTSGSTEPLTWPTSGTVSDGGVTWACNGATPPKNWSADTAYTVNDIVYPSNGYQYICTIAGISGNTAPSWGSTGWTGYDTTSGVNKVQWTYRGIQPLLVLKSNIDTNATLTVYGDSYSVIDNKFIKFVGSGSNYTEDTATGALPSGNADYGKYLKVTIGLPSGGGETISTLFTRR